MGWYAMKNVIVYQFWDYFTTNCSPIKEDRRSMYWYFTQIACTYYNVFIEENI